MKKIYATLCKLEVYAAATCFIASCIIIFGAALMRTIGKPLLWTMDMALFLFAWSVFLSADAALRAGKLVRVELLVNTFKPNVQRIITIGHYVIIIAFLIALIVYGVKLAIFSRIRTFQGIPGFSYMWVTFSIPVGAALQLATVISKLRKLIILKPS